MNDKFQFVELSGVKTPKTSVDKGVAQGSIPAPVFFILYIIDVNKCCSLKMVNFAHDSTAYGLGIDISVLTGKKK